MKCPECGANLKKISPKCTECGAQLKAKRASTVSAQAPVVESAPAVSIKQAQTAKPTPSLIEFPGVNRNALPEWRKELSERVREKQERRAREAVLEAQGEIATTVDAPPATVPVILELLPQTEMPAVNPIVEAALKRLERANLQPSSFSHGNAALATAVAYDERRGFAEADEASSLLGAAAVDPNTEATEEARPERVHNLTVVPNSAVIEENVPAVITKPRRLISDANNPALNYLDTVPTSVWVERMEYIAASSARRALAAFVDLVIVFALASPLLALNSLTSLDWQNWRVIAFSAASIGLVGFLYLTIITAFTGRTLGMRLCSLRVVDARNGLIPTGGQSAARALVYLLSLVPAGILSLYVFVDSE
ncbi:MAG: RDD family protein, partial [bacterium]